MIFEIQDIEENTTDLYNYSIIQQAIGIFLFSLYIFFSVLLVFNKFDIGNPIIQFSACGFGFTFYLTYIYFIIRRYQLYKTNLVTMITLKNNINVSKDYYCIICLELFNEGLASKLSCKCNCYYHSECIKHWLDINNICPVGRCKISIINNNN